MRIKPSYIRELPHSSDSQKHSYLILWLLWKVAQHLLWCKFGYDRHVILVLFPNIKYQPSHSELSLFPLTMTRIPFCCSEIWLLLNARSLISPGPGFNSPQTAIPPTHPKPFLFILEKEEVICWHRWKPSSGTLGWSPNALCFSFLICKIGTVIGPTSSGCCEA